MDDTFIVQLSEHKEKIHKHINNIDQSIKFTVEDTFSYILCYTGTRQTLSTRVNRKFTHRQTSIHEGTAITT